MGKLHYFTLLLLIILLAVVSGGIFDSIEKKPGKKSTTVKHEPDFYLENFKATSMSENGTPAYIIQASYLEHYPDDDSMELTKPVLESFTENQKVWEAKSDTASYFQTKKIIHLVGNVELVETPSNNKKQDEVFHLKAKKIKLDIRKNIVTSKSHVTIYRQGLTITANKLHADLNSKKIKFSSRTTSKYVY